MVGLINKSAHTLYNQIKLDAANYHDLLFMNVTNLQRKQ